MITSQKRLIHMNDSGANINNGHWGINGFHTSSYPVSLVLVGVVLHGMPIPDPVTFCKGALEEANAGSKILTNVFCLPCLKIAFHGLFPKLIHYGIRFSRGLCQLTRSGILP